MRRETNEGTWGIVYSTLVVGVVSATVFIALHPKVIDLFSLGFLGGASGDGGLYVWLTQSFIGDPKTALSFETEAFHPYPLTRAWSDSYLIPGAITWLLVFLGLPFATAYNALLVLALAANGSATYLISRRIGVQPLYALAAALIFANSSYFLGNLGHPQLLFFFWVPLAWSIVLPSADGTMSSARAWMMSGFCVSCAFYTAVYYAIFAALGLAIMWLVELVQTGASLRRSLRVVLCAAVGMLPIVYAFPAYYAVQGYFGSRGLYEAEAFAASGLSYLSFTPAHDLYSLTARLTHSEAYLGAGYLILALAGGFGFIALVRRQLLLAIVGFISLAVLCVSSSVVDSGVRSEHAVCTSAWVVLLSAVLAVRKKGGPLAVFLLVSAVFFVFSFGPGGNPVKGEPTYTPLGLLYQRFPGLSAVRAVARFGIVALMAIMVGAAYALQSLVARSSRSRQGVRAAFAAAVLCGVGLFENSVFKVQIDASPPAPQALVEYAKTGGKKPAVILPFSGVLNSQGVPASWTDFALLHSTYSVWNSQGTQFPMVNGYSGQRSKLQTELPRVLEDFPSTAGLSYLARLCGVRSVLVAPAVDSKWDATRFDEKIAHYQKEIVDVKKYSDGSIAMQLGQLSIASGSEHPTVLFAMRSRPARLLVQNAAGAACEIAVASLAKSSNGEVLPIRVETYLVSEPQEIRVVPPPRLSRASPHIIQVATHGCSVEISCLADG